MPRGATQPAAATPTRVAAPDGAGGLSTEPAPTPGVPSQLARAESDEIQLNPGRIILEKSGGKAPSDARVMDTAVPGLRQRDRSMRDDSVRRLGGSESSERAVELGLEFLARYQNAHGSWRLRGFSRGVAGLEDEPDAIMQSDTAATGLALLAFLGAGYTHTDGKYREVVDRGIAFLLAAQKPNGDLFIPMDAQSDKNVWLYSHGIASIAMCEAYGMTRDPSLERAAQGALDFIVASQHPDEGGWRYAPRSGADTSVSGWQLMALKSGELAGLNAPADCYERVRHWLDGAKASGEPGLYVYRPSSKQAHQKSPSRVMTAEGMLMRQYLGWNRENPEMIAGADHLLANLPLWEGRGQRDSYYWYYATQVMFQMQGDYWKSWNDRLRKLLTERQVTKGPAAGSWEPLGAVPDRWGREGGRIYVTAMHLLMLEVYYRHLPLYRNLDESGQEAE